MLTHAGKGGQRRGKGILKNGQDISKFNTRLCNPLTGQGTWTNGWCKT